MNNSHSGQSGVGALLGYKGGLGQSAVDTAIVQAVESGSEVGLLPLFSILPDPNQPRDLLPKQLYERLFTGEPPPTVMQTWLTQTKNDAVSPSQKHCAMTCLASGSVAKVVLGDLIHRTVNISTG